MKQRNLTELPEVLLRMDSVRFGALQGGRWPMVMGDQTGWCSTVKHGICAAFVVDAAPLDELWLVQASLWLASLREQLDDSLWLDDGTLYFTRRYDRDIAANQLRVGLEQQGAVARWLNAHHAAVLGAHHVGQRA
ncbi:hypothetical protein [Burkholderia ubonensis]|uniref:hypothetical protein n=1 Tax=Burkholderia ubonensis TaxID=101571 RepID=UPI0012F8F412|nr:hypothetical protein [Burkholderia ubonensis]